MKYEKQPNGPFSSMREGCNQTADLCLGHGVKWVLEDGTTDNYTVVCKQTYHHYSDFRSQLISLRQEREIIFEFYDLFKAFSHRPKDT